MFRKHFLIPNGATEGAWFVVNGITHFVNGKSVIAESVRVIRSEQLPANPGWTVQQSGLVAILWLLMVLLGACMQYWTQPRAESIRWKQSE
jgi:hypothetical protein